MIAQKYFCLYFAENFEVCNHKIMNSSSFLFSFSKISKDASLEDCIRQSQIEILSRHPPLDQIKTVFQNGLNALIQSPPLKHTTIHQIIDLLVTIYESYPEVYKIFNKFSHNHPNLIIFAFSIHKGDGFASNINKQLLPQLTNTSCHTYSYLNYDISKATAIFLCVNALLCKSLTNKIVNTSFQYLIQNEYPFSSALLYKAKKENCMNFIPESIFNTICQFSNILSILEGILPKFPKEIFLTNYDRIFNQIKENSPVNQDKSKDKDKNSSNNNNENNNNNNARKDSYNKSREVNLREVSQVSKIMIQKINEFDLDDKVDDISTLLEFYSSYQFLPSNSDGIIQILKKYSDKIKIGPNFSSVLTDFNSDIITFLKLHPDPCSQIPPTTFVAFFNKYIKDQNNTSNISLLDWNKIFKSFFKNKPKIDELHNPELWLNFFKLEKFEDNTISFSAQTYSANFQENSTYFLDVLFQLLYHSEISIVLCKFVQCLWEDDDNPTNQFIQDVRMVHLLNEDKSIKSVSQLDFHFPHYFWKIFPNIRSLMNLSSKPNFVFGMSCVLFEEKVTCSVPREVTITIIDQNEQSNNLIKSFIETNFQSFDEMLQYFDGNPIKENQKALSLISAAFMFSASYLKYSIESTSPMIENLQNIKYKNIPKNLFSFFRIVFKVIELKHGITMSVFKSLVDSHYFTDSLDNNSLEISFPLNEFRIFLINSYLLFIFKHSRIFLTFEGMAELLIKTLSPLWSKIDLLTNDDEKINEMITIPLLELILTFPQRTANKVALACIESGLPVFIPLLLKNASKLNNSNINRNLEQPFKLHCQLLKFNKDSVLNYFNDHFPPCDLNYATFAVKICPLVVLLTLFSGSVVEANLVPELRKSLKEKRNKDAKVLIKFIHFSNNDNILLRLIEEEKSNITKLSFDSSIRRVIYINLAEKNREAILSMDDFSIDQIIYQKVSNQESTEDLDNNNASSNRQSGLKSSIVNFVLNLVMDFDVTVNYYRLLLENQIDNDIYIRANSLISYFVDAYNKNPQQLCTALNESYIGPLEGQDILVKRAQKIPLHPTSPKIIEFIQNEFINKEDYEILKEIANMIPFIFNSYDQLFLLNEICFKGFKINQSPKNRQNAIMFTAFLAMNPEFLDVSIPFMLEKIDPESDESNTLTSDDKLLSLIFIESVLLTPALQFIMASLLMKANWNTIAYQLLQQSENDQNDEETKLMNEEIKSYVIQITLLFVNVLNKVDFDEADLLDEIQNCEQPFKEAAGGNICFPLINLNIIKSYFQTDKKNSKNGKNNKNEGNNFIFSRVTKLKKKNISTINFDQLLENLSETTLPSNQQIKFNLPEGISENNFKHLPSILQSSFLYNIVSHLTLKLNARYLNSLQKRYLIHQPLWISQVIENSQTFDLTRVMLPPEHYLMLIPVLEHLIELSSSKIIQTADEGEMFEVGEVEDVSKEDLTLLHYCQQDLIQYLLDFYLKPINFELIRRNYSPSKAEKAFFLLKQQQFLSFELIISFSNNITSFLAIADLLNHKTSTEKNINQMKLLRLLKVLSKSSEFVNVFSSFKEILMNLLSVLYETRQYKQIISVIHIFLKLGDEIPNAAIQYSVLLLYEGSNPNKVMLPGPLFKEVLKICSNLPQSKLDDIAPYISEKFSRFLSKFQQKKHTDMLNLYLANFPFLITANYDELIKILRDLLSRYHAENLATICVLFDNLCPKRQPAPFIPLNQDSEVNSNSNNNSNSSSNQRSKFSLFSSFFDFSNSSSPSKGNSGSSSARNKKGRKSKRGSNDDDNRNSSSSGRRKNRIIQVPGILFNQAPLFWQVVEDHSKLIESLIEDHLFNELKFLTNYPEIIQFQSRIDFFKKNQSKKLSSDSPTSIHDAIMHALDNPNEEDRRFSFLQLLLGSGNTFRIEVRRSNILADSYRKLHNIETKDWLKKFRINYIDEDGVDAGGLRKDWFSSLVKNLFNPNYALFVPSSNGRAYQPSPSSYVNPEHIEYFTFAGKILARALIEGITVEAHMTRAFLKQILGQQESMSLTDIEDCDESLHQSFLWILNNDVEPLDMYFTADFDDMGNHKLINLKENGDQIRVTNENKEEFVRLQVNHRLVHQIAQQTKAFLDGFYSLILFEEIRMFKPDELNLIICGVPDIDIDDFKQNVKFSGSVYNKNHNVIKMFFRVISRWSGEDMAKLLLFITGSSQVPFGGFKELASIGKPITIDYGGDSSRFPVSHTCTNTLDLPAYSNETELEKKLIFSINECNSFGIA